MRKNRCSKCDISLAKDNCTPTILGRGSGFCHSCNKIQRQKYTGYHREIRFGVTQEEFDDRFRAQKGLCKICKQLMVAGSRGRSRPCQDHNHITGKLRDLLCASCNFVLGHSFENQEILAGTIRYLQEHTEISN